MNLDIAVLFCDKICSFERMCHTHNKKGIIWRETDPTWNDNIDVC